MYCDSQCYDILARKRRICIFQNRRRKCARPLFLKSHFYLGTLKTALFQAFAVSGPQGLRDHFECVYVQSDLYIRLVVSPFPGTAPCRRCCATVRGVMGLKEGELFLCAAWIFTLRTDIRFQRKGASSLPDQDM